MSFARSLPLCLLTVLVSSAARADELLLTNGDHLTGQVQSLIRGQLTFKTEKAGTVRVAVGEIRRFTLDRPSRILLTDKTALIGTITTNPEGSLILAAEGVQRPVALTDIAAINPDIVRWRGGVTAGVTILDNLINTRQWNITAQASRIAPTTDLSFDGAYLRSRQGRNTTEDFAYLNGEVKFGKNQRRFGFFNTNLRTDKVQKLDLRVLSGAGIGFHWLRGPAWDLTTNTGLSYRSDDFQAAPVERKLAAEVGYQLRWNAARGTTFRHDLHYFPTLNDPGDSYLLTQFQLDQDFTERLYLNARVIQDQTTRPGPNAARVTRKITVGLGARF